MLDGDIAEHTCTMLDGDIAEHICTMLDGDIAEPGRHRDRSPHAAK